MKLGFVSGILFGGLAGGVYGLLKAPRTGEENKENMKSYLDDTTVLVQDVTEKVKDLKGAISELTNEGKYLASDFSKEMNDTAQAFTYEAEPRMRRIQEQAEKLTKDAQTMQGNLQEAGSESKNAG